MDTLLERLRVQQEWFSEGHGTLHKEAADEIERLEAVIARYQERGHCPSCDGDHL